MSYRVNWLLIPALALGVVACKKTEEAKSPSVPTSIAEVAPGDASPLPIPVIAPLSPTERAAKLGFVRHLPQDTEVVLAFYDGSKSVARVKASKMWKLVEQQMGGGVTGFPEEGLEMEDEDPETPEAGQGEDAEANAAQAEPTGPAALFSSEFTLALGNTSGEQTGNLLKFYRRMSYFQMRSMAKNFATAVKSGDAAELGASLSNPYGAELMKELLNDPEAGIQLFAKTRMPPVYLAFRTTLENRESAALQLSGLVANVGLIGEMVEPAEIVHAGHSFAGFRIRGEKIAASMAQGRESLEAGLSPAMVDELLATVAKKDVVIVSGTVGDYVVLFLGSSLDDLKLAPEINESMVATDSLAFSDAYATKELAAIVYGEKEAMDTLIAAVGGMAEITNGLRDGLAGSDGLGDTRDLETMLQIVAEREAALRKLASNETTGTVAFFEDGLKIESYGGTDRGMIDWTSPRQLSHLGDSDDVVLFLNTTTDGAYDEKARDYVEALLETSYAMAMKVAEAPLEGDEMARFQKMATMIDSNFRTEMVVLWDALVNGFGASLGRECAVVVDFKGSAPAVPGISQELLDSARVPRISWVAPVNDRAKLAASWDKMNTTLTGTLAKISGLTGQNLPMQKPISSEKDGNISWFIAMPFFNDDFLPSVTVSDRWFAASTSKTHAVDLLSKAGAEGEPRSGLWLKMDFKMLQAYAMETLKLVDENAQDLLGGPLPDDRRVTIRTAIAALADLDQFTLHVRRENSVLRSSMHFKTR